MSYIHFSTISYRKMESELLISANLITPFVHEHELSPPSGFASIANVSLFKVGSFFLFVHQIGSEPSLVAVALSFGACLSSLSFCTEKSSLTDSSMFTQAVWTYNTTFTSDPRTPGPSLVQSPIIAPKATVDKPFKKLK